MNTTRTAKQASKKIDATIVANCREAAAALTEEYQAALDAGDLELADAVLPELHEVRAQLAAALAGR